MSTFMLHAPSVRKKLSPLLRVINSTTVLPILETVVIEAGEYITFTATDLENLLTLSVDALHSEGDFKFCLHGKKLMQVLNNSLDDSVSFKVGKGKVKIENGGFNLSSETPLVDNFPKTPVIDKFKEFTIDCKEIYTHFLNALQFVSNDDLRPALTGIWLGDHKGELFITGTDAHRMYYGRVMKTPGSLSKLSSIIPKRGVRCFLDIFKTGPVNIRISDQHIEFYQTGARLISRLIDARYPDWPSVLPDNNISFEMQRKNLVSFLKMAAPFVNPSTSQITFTINNNGIGISGGDKDFGEELNYKMPVYNCNAIFPPFRFAVNLKFLSMIANLKKDEYCKFLHSGLPTKAIIVDDCCLLMPLMLNDID